MSVTASVVDELLEQIEAALPSSHVEPLTRTRVRDRARVIDTVPLFGIARDLVMTSLTDPEDADRAKLQQVFGGDCVRLCRTRSYVEEAQRVLGCGGAEWLGSDSANDRRVPQCLDAVESVEAVLRDLGLGWQLQRALEAYRWSRARHGLGPAAEPGEPAPRPLAVGQDGPLPGSPALTDPLSALREAASRSPSLGSPPRACSGGDDSRSPSSGSAAGTRTAVTPEELVDRELATPRAAPSRAEAQGGEAPAAAERPGAGADAVPSAAPAPRTPLPRPALVVEIVASRKAEDGVTWYGVRVREDGERRFLHRRYTDFCALHEELTLACHSASALKLPGLPPAGLIGFRHRLNLGRFNDKRQCGLQHYLEDLVRQARPLSACAPLAAFLGHRPGLAACVWDGGGNCFWEASADAEGVGRKRTCVSGSTQLVRLENKRVLPPSPQGSVGGA